jgi:hypothetical protein
MVHEFDPIPSKRNSLGKSEQMIICLILIKSRKSRHQRKARSAFSLQQSLRYALQNSFAQNNPSHLNRGNDRNAKTFIIGNFPQRRKLRGEDDERRFRFFGAAGPGRVDEALHASELDWCGFTVGKGAERGLAPW